MMDLLSCEGIKGFLPEILRDVIKVEYYPEADSTNTIAKKRAAQGEDEGLFVVAGKQTAGRGRLGRSFYSPDDTGLYMSLLLRPSITPEQSVLITTAAAVSVCDALEKVGVKSTAIKWVNDVLIDGKKICGILTEGGINPKTAKFDWAVVGIGVNAYVPDGGFEDDIADIATAVFDKKEDNLRNRFVAEILNRFWDFYSKLKDNTFFNDYKNRMINIGKEIKIIKGDKEINAKCLDLDDNCRLLVDYGDDMEYLTSGEISIKINA